MSRYVSDIVNEKIINSEKLSGLTEKEKEEAATIITSDTNDYIEMSGEIKYGEKEKIGKMVEDAIDNLERKGSIEFSEEYMIGKLINVLDDDKATEKLISGLSQVMTDKPFSTFFGGKELVEIFQTMRPALMKLYVEKSVDEVYEWFEK
ncbi:Cro/Cl family transcriptional regulator [Enterococcus faecalis]|nr:Cro/Cl family transcriptional regulator [Enterococcus faecalis]